MKKAKGLGSQKINWSPQEIEYAKTLMRLFGKDGFAYVCKELDGCVSLTDGDQRDGAIGWFSVGIERDAFPSLRPGQTVSFRKIVGGDD